MKKTFPRVIGLTGGLGSGKSTVAEILRRRGFRVMSADTIVREELSSQGKAFAAVAKLFGPGVLTGEGEFDRRRIADRVFKDPSLRRRLEKILHPAVRRRYRTAIVAGGKRLLVLDTPLLFEAGVDRLVDATVVVDAPWALRLRRVRDRGMTAADARRREKAQWSLRRKKSLADHIVRNNGTFRDLEGEVARLLQRMMAKGGHSL